MNLFPSPLLSTVYWLFPFLGLTHGSWCSQSASLHQLTMWAVPLSNSTNPQSIVQSTAQRGPGSLSSYQIMSPQGTHSFLKWYISTALYVAVVRGFCDSSYISRATQFRWIQKDGTGERQSWAVDHVYIGEACPGLCSGHGYCTSGVVCICDEGHHGMFSILETHGFFFVISWIVKQKKAPCVIWCRKRSKWLNICLFPSASAHSNRWRLLPLQQWLAQLHQGQLWIRQRVSGELAADPGWWSRQWMWAAVTARPRRLTLL